MRAWGALWLLAFFLWLPIEDTHIWLALGLAAAASLWGARRWRPAMAAGRPAALAWGAGLGLAVPLLAIGLMAFKSGLHGHGFPDFTARQTLQVLRAAPWGALAGIGLTLLHNRLS